MRYRLALLMLLGAVVACDRRPQTKVPPRPSQPSATALSEQQVRERSEQCASASRAVFQRDWQDGGTGSAHGRAAAQFMYHYNAKLDTCFYLVTVDGREVRSRKLFDVSERELYGEYLGAAVDESPMKNLPSECHVAGLYCASGREWEVLVRYFMEG